MNRTIFRSTVGSDGVLHLDVPLGPAEANREVEVTVRPLGPAPTQEEWRALVLSTAGTWRGEFERPPQVAFEEREPL